MFFDLFLKLIIKYTSEEQKSIIFNSLEYASNQQRYNGYRRKYNIDESFKFNGKDILFNGEGKIICGAKSYMGDYSTIEAVKDCKVQIGVNCSISHNVRIYTLNKKADQDLSLTELELVSGDVIIEDNVWIGANVFIKEGITIGSNSVVGANSIVTKNIPSNSISGGVPARLIKMKNY